MEWYTKEMKDLEKDLHAIDLINKLRARIAELEAEVELLKSPYSFFVLWQQDQIKKLEEAKQENSTTGEG